MKKPFILKSLAKSSNLQEKLDIKIVIYQHNFEDMIPLNTTLSDSDLTEEDGWVWLPANESAILTLSQEQKSIYLYLQLSVVLGVYRAAI